MSVRDRAAWVLKWQSKMFLGCEDVISAAIFVCQTVVARCPADDELPMNKEWLASLRALQQRDVSEWAIHDQSKCYVLFFTENFDGVFSANLVDDLADIPLGDVVTRGDFRRLCRGLKFDLNEGKA